MPKLTVRCIKQIFLVFEYKKTRSYNICKTNSYNIFVEIFRPEIKCQMQIKCATFFVGIPTLATSTSLGKSSAMQAQSFLSAIL